MMIVEQWRVVARAPDYEVSDFGRVRRTTDNRRYKVGRLRKIHLDTHGYPSLGLTMPDGKERRCKVHQLVCEAFHGPRPSLKHDVAHRDGNRANPNADNLRWATRAENMADAILHGTLVRPRGEAVANTNLTDAAVAQIRATPRRRGLLRALAAEYGVSRNRIANLRTRGNGLWPHVPFPDHDHPPA